MMEVFAGFVTHTDAQIGRVLEFLRATDQLDDTLVLLISDNGTSGEGGPDRVVQRAPLHPRPGRRPRRHPRPASTTSAGTAPTTTTRGAGRGPGNTPLRLWKRYAWLGGVRTPLIVHWPAGIDAAAAGQVRDQFCHAVDLLPTVLDAAGRRRARPSVDGVDQLPLDGASLRPTFAADGAAAPSPRSTQYFEILGSRSIVHDGWKATTDHIGNQITVEREQVPGSHDFDDDHWALFHLDDDFAEAHDLAAEHPERVAELEPAGGTRPGATRCCRSTTASSGGRWRWSATRTRPGRGAVYRPGGRRHRRGLPARHGRRLPRSSPRSTCPTAGEQGVVCALGDWSNGWAWYLVDGRPVVAFNLFGTPCRVAAPDGADAPAATRSRCATSGRPPAAVRWRCASTARSWRRARCPRTCRSAGRSAAPACGSAATPASRCATTTRPPFAFTGTIDHVAVESAGYAPPADRPDVADRPRRAAGVTTSGPARRRSITLMPTDDRDDPGADTAMFRAYVEQPAEAPPPAQDRTVIIGLVVAIVVLAVIALVLVVA